MPHTIKIKTWFCENCNYLQDFNPNNTQQWQEIFPYIKQGMCPNTTCTTHPKLKLQTDSTKQIRVNIVTDKEIDNYADEELVKDETRSKLKTKAKADRAKYNSAEWKA